MKQAKRKGIIVINYEITVNNPEGIYTGKHLNRLAEYEKKEYVKEISKFVEQVNTSPRRSGSRKTEVTVFE